MYEFSHAEFLKEVQLLDVWKMHHNIKILRKKDFLTLHKLGSLKIAILAAASLGAIAEASEAAAFEAEETVTEPMTDEVSESVSDVANNAEQSANSEHKNWLITTFAVGLFTGFLRLIGVRRFREGAIMTLQTAHKSDNDIKQLIAGLNSRRIALLFALKLMLILTGFGGFTFVLWGFLNNLGSVVLTLGILMVVVAWVVGSGLWRTVLRKHTPVRS